MYAYICKQQSLPEKTTPLQIDGGEIRFLIDPIREHAKFLSAEGGQRWFLTFFNGSPFPQKLTVYFYPKAVPDFKNDNYVGKACVLDNGENSLPTPVVLKEASKFLRNSETLGAEQVAELTDGRSLVVDRDGVVYFSRAIEQFKRVVLCQALAIAYTQVLYDCIRSLTTHIKSDAIEDTISLYEKILRFNAADYFSLPVDLTKHELFAVWQALTQHYRLKMLSEELTQQLSEVAMLLTANREASRLQQEKDREKQDRALREKVKADDARQKANEDKKDKRRTFWVSVVGVLLTASSLTQATPKQIGEALDSWKTWWKGSETTQTVTKPESSTVPVLQTNPPPHRKK